MGAVSAQLQQAIALVADQAGEAQTALLERLGEAIASAEVRVLDPASFKLRSASQRRKALAVTVQPRISRESRLAAAMHRAEAGAFALSNDDVMEGIRKGASTRKQGSPAVQLAHRNSHRRAPCDAGG